mgnify:CR=1 FL=1
MDSIEFLKKSIKRGTTNVRLEKAIKDARFQLAVYSGIDQDYIVTDYRKGESKPQQEQRLRITTTRTKHTSRQIENVIDQLEVMSKPAINVLCDDNEEAEEGVKAFINDESISDLAFNFTKYYNMTDANAFLTCGENEHGDIEFNAIGVNNVYDYYMVNKKLRMVVFTSTRLTKEGNVNDYHAYSDTEVVKFTNVKGSGATEEDQEYEMIGDNTYKVDRIETKINRAFRLGYIEDMTNNQETCLTIMDAASELLKGLIWQGSELDTIDATQGIIKQFAYARRCGYQFTNNDYSYSCVGGFLRSNGAMTQEKCPKCSGGLEIHTSSQDIVYFPMPQAGEDLQDLSRLIHTEFIPTQMLEYKKQYIKEIKDDIIKTVFNASMVTKDDLNKTATEAMIDLQGIYAVLNQIGKQVTKTFTWMVQCACFIKYDIPCIVIHGYTLNLKLEDIQSLSATRKTLIEANAPTVLLKAIDMAMIEKQHLSSPIFIARYSVWESFRPFSGKSNSEISQIISGLPNTNEEKILHNYFGKIRSAIDRTKESEFYNGTYEQQKSIINDEIQIIKASLQDDLVGTGRVEFNEID